MKKLRDISFDHSIRRTKYEIWAEILEICLMTPHYQSFILRELRLKTVLVKSALNFLLERDLLEEFTTEGELWTQYRTTPKGKEALSKFYDLFTQYFTPNFDK